MSEIEKNNEYVLLVKNDEIVIEPKQEKPKRRGRKKTE
jgi:hypothetical protein